MRSFLNRRRYTRRHLLLDCLLLALFAIALGLIGFFRWYEMQAAALARENSLPKSAANGIKHAYAAAGVYHAVRSVGIGSDTAENMVMGLGLLNEYAERLVRSPKDTTAEVAKDLHNNYIGVMLARENGAAGYAAVVRLAREGVIAATPEEIGSGLPESSPPDIGAAHAWFKAEKEKIAAKIRP